PAPPGSIGCAAGGGTTSTPAFALLRSTGTDSDGNPRLLRGTYTFRVKNTNVAGGLIHAGGKQGPCLDAGNLPVPSRLLVAAPCAESRPQTFAYNTDLSLSLPSSKSGALPSGLCVTGDGVLGHRVSLQPCAAGAVTQQWAFGTYNHFVGTNDLCLGVGAGPTYPIVLDDDCARMPKWWPEPSVGAGAAGPTTGQMVNFAQFGWCLDLILKRLNLGSTSQPIVQTYQCTQAGPTTEVSWNQKWNPPALPDGPDAASGRLTVTAVGDGPRDDPDNFAPHCLTTPLGAHRYPHLTPCDANATGSRWQFHGENGGYAESFTIVDINGRCLTPETDRDTDESAHVLVAPCDGSALQKWNAPWYTKPPQPLKDISEH
ncbi:MAG TPA: ricin-type beta-trefoil lectin domain protein, partial [Catenuloplanes sp.]